jgi:hypothetical protein
MSRELQPIVSVASAHEPSAGLMPVLRRASFARRLQHIVRLFRREHILKVLVVVHATHGWVTAKSRHCARWGRTIENHVDSTNMRRGGWDIVLDQELPP